MANTENKTVPTDASVDDFLDTVESDARRADARAFVKLFRKLTGWPPRMWGPSIVGFGAYRYEYASGRSGTMCAVGFSPRKAATAIYWGKAGGTTDALLAKLGRHKAGGGCLYVTKLSDVDVTVLEKLLTAGLANLKKEWPVTAK